MSREAVAAVDHHDALRDSLEIYRPVERRVAATHEEHAFSGEHLRIEDAVVEPLPYQRSTSLRGRQHAPRIPA